MSINVKPINEVPEIEALSEGDKLLVNSGGAAKQIDASKVGGSGGGGVIIYCQIIGENEDGLTASCHKSADRTESNVMTFVEFAGLASSGPVSFAISEDGAHEIYLSPMMLMPVSETSTAMAIVYMGTSSMGLTLYFPDSAGME